MLLSVSLEDVLVELDELELEELDELLEELEESVSESAST